MNQQILRSPRRTQNDKARGRSGLLRNEIFLYNECVKRSSSKKNLLSFSVVYEADPDGGYIAYIPSLPGCHTQGDTLEEAERNLKEAATVYLEDVLAERGVLPYETRTLHGKIEVAV